MRIRSVKPSVHRDAELWDLEQETGLPIFRAFVGLWGAADREGRFKWSPRELKVDILPYWEGDFSRVLHALTTRGFVVRYVVKGREYGLVRTFKVHQLINNKEAPSSLPKPEDDPNFSNEPNELTREARVDDATVTADDPALEKNVRKGTGREQEQELCVGTEPRTLAQELRDAFVKTYTPLRAGPPNERDTSAMVTAVASWIETGAPLRGMTESALCQKLVAAFFASPAAAENRFKPSWLAKDPDEFLSPPRALSAVRGGRSGPGPVATRAELEAAALQNPDWMNDPPANGVGK